MGFSMRRYSIGILVTIGLIAACSSGSDGDAVEELMETACRTPQEETSALQAQFRDALDEAAVRTTDEECVIYSQTDVNLACFTNCANAIHTAERESIDTLAVSLQERLDSCEGGPCPVPSCPPQPVGAECVSNRCELIRSAS